MNTTDLCFLAQYTPLTRHLITPVLVPFLFHSQAGLTAIWWEWLSDCFHVPSMLVIVVVYCCLINDDKCYYFHVFNTLLNEDATSVLRKGMWGFATAKKTLFDVYKGRITLPNRRNFWKSSKGEGESFSIQKFMLQILGTLNRAFWAWNWSKRVISGFKICFF